MLHSQIKWVMAVALTSAVFGSNIQSVKAQTSVNNEFEITYDALTVIAPIENQPGFFTANIAGTSQDNSPFGLTKFESNAFGKLVSQETVTDENGNISEVQKLEFNANPDILGLANPPQSIIDRRIELGIPNPEENSDIYFGDSGNKLFGQAADQATLNLFPPGSPDFPGTIRGGGIITITGGTGIFENASGEITFEQSDRLPEDPTAPALGKATLKFTVQTPQQVPESANGFGLAMGIVGTSLIVRQNRRQARFKQ
ncbi:hypothetical protein IQ247_00270 [Plectonema cf. radiosum LEGE 06105]|uniref:Uncharacterized protein n=1 Tax=Plectonema cf. radiosum LEGE 06105 TaxID=945769 RepID=A0A8J7F2J6_9CYAN|nr:hypothetical protein [Plectonema radiosum]MBE9211164.1 hypothetical protein [Plectonema cf. radiosum LEGE 06105]